MKLTIERAALVAALAPLGRIVERRNTIPILSNVRLAAGGQGLRLTSTNLDIEAVWTAPAQVEEGGATTVSAHTLGDIARKLPDGAQVVIETGKDTSQILVRAGRSRFVLQTLPSEDFPDLAAGEFPHRFGLPANLLADMLAKCSFAVSTEETRYYLNGVYLHVVEAEDGPTLRMVATDGHKLARVDVPAPDGAAGIPGVILPRYLVAELERLAKGATGEVGIEVSTTKVRVTVGPALVLTSKLIDGTFPDYGRVIPTGNDKEAVVEREAFGAAVSRVATISGERGRAVRLEFSAGRVELSCINPDLGTANEEVEASYDADPIALGFNSSYLAEILDTLACDTLRVTMGDPGSPCLLQSTTAKDVLVVLMPMRV